MQAIDVILAHYSVSNRARKHVIEVLSQVLALCLVRIGPDSEL